MATTFELQVAMDLEQPIIIAVISCLVKRYAGIIQLSATPATYYYLNPKVPEADHIRAVYNDLLGPLMPLPLVATHQQPQQEPAAEEPMSIATLLEINPEKLVVWRFYISL